MKGKSAPAEAGKRPLVEGPMVRLAGRDWIVAPLTLGQLRRLATAIAKLDGSLAITDPDWIDGVLALAHASLSRNYPDLTEIQVEEMVDLANAGALLAAIMGASGLKQGEDRAAATSAATSVPSMPSLPPAAGSPSP